MQLDVLRGTSIFCYFFNEFLCWEWFFIGLKVVLEQFKERLCCFEELVGWV